MRIATLIGLGLLTFTALTGAFAQIPEEVKSGPQAGEFLPGPFHYLNINGPFAGEMHSLDSEFGLRPTVVIFTHDPGDSQPLTILLQKLDADVAKYHDAELRCFCVFLNEKYHDEDLRRFVVFPGNDAAKEEENRRELIGRLEKLSQDAALKNVILCAGPASGPKGYNINKEAEATVLLYKKLKVVENYALPKGRLNERYTNAILASVDQLVGGK